MLFEAQSLETALFFETVEEIYARVFRTLRPRTARPEVLIRYRKYANATSRIRLTSGRLEVDISDLLEGAPAPIQEALATILISKLFRRAPEKGAVARYRRYLDRADMRRVLHLVKQERGRKTVRDPRGQVYDLCTLFEDLNLRYFHGLMARPNLGWSVKPSRTVLGHFDPSHNTIVLTCLLDSVEVPQLAVEYVMYHEMLHLRFPTEHRGGRRCVHTKQFREAENLFDGLAAAKSSMRRFLETLS